VRRVRILKAAAAELDAAANWYNLQQPGLGIEFDQAVNTALDLVVRDLPDETVVVAIAHQSRRPGYWRDRQGS
jgi:hypothetical protein